MFLFVFVHHCPDVPAAVSDDDLQVATPGSPPQVSRVLGLLCQQVQAQLSAATLLDNPAWEQAFYSSVKGVAQRPQTVDKNTATMLVTLTTARLQRHISTKVKKADRNHWVAGFVVRVLASFVLACAMHVRAILHGVVLTTLCVVSQADNLTRLAAMAILANHVLRDLEICDENSCLLRIANWERNWVPVCRECSHFEGSYAHIDTERAVVPRTGKACSTSAQGSASCFNRNEQHTKNAAKVLQMRAHAHCAYTPHRHVSDCAQLLVTFAAGVASTAAFRSSTRA